MPTTRLATVGYMEEKFKRIRGVGEIPVYGTWSCTVGPGLSTQISPVNRQTNTTENITLATALAGDKNPVVLLTLGFHLTRIAYLPTKSKLTCPKGISL